MRSTRRGRQLGPSAPRGRGPDGWLSPVFRRPRLSWRWPRAKFS